MTSFIAVVALLISVQPVLAADHRERLLLRVESVEGNPAGISVGDEFVGTFEADESILDMPDGVHDGHFVEFDLAIGPVEWNESHVTDQPMFLINSGLIEGVQVTITDTMPAHPNLMLNLPASPGSWSVEDEDDSTGQPIYGGSFGGTYTLEFIPDGVPALRHPSYAMLAALLLITGVVFGVISKRTRRTCRG